MLKRAQRVKRVVFTDFFKKGKRVHSEYLTVVYTPFPTFHGSVVVSKKVSKKAVERNRIRRRIYHTLANHAPSSQTGVFIVVVKPPYINLTRKQAKSEVEALVVRTLKSA
jgi:ribonuclease P protein component